MKRPFTSALTLAFALSPSALAQDDKPAPEPYANDFESETVGELPDKMMEIDGSFTVVEVEGGGKVLQMSADPLAENAVLFGPSLKGPGTVKARAKGLKKRRSMPRFGVGLHGISGFRLRVVPAKKEVELVKNEEVVTSMAYAWKADAWVTLELHLAADGDAWKVEGRVWSEGEERPAEATISTKHEGVPGQGKASVWGTAYSGKVIEFDDISIVPGG